MAEAKVAGTEPCLVDVEEGKTYMWCTCGLSEKQPFCDGKHGGTEFSPHIFTAEKSTTMVLCACKRTGNIPRCDGSHSRIR